MTDEIKKRVEEIERDHAARCDLYSQYEVSCTLCFLLSTVKELEEENGEYRVLRTALAETQEKTSAAHRELLASNANYKQAAHVYSGLAMSLEADLAKEREENERLRSLIRIQETEPPADVPDDQTTEMAVRIAELESDLAKEREEKEGWKQTAKDGYGCNLCHCCGEVNHEEAQVQRLAAEKRIDSIRTAHLSSGFCSLSSLCSVCIAIEGKGPPSITDPKDEIKEPPGIECEGCGARINPEYAKCTRCE